MYHMYKKKKYLCLLLTGALCVCASSSLLQNRVWAVSESSGLSSILEEDLNSDTVSDPDKTPSSDPVSDSDASQNSSEASVSDGDAPDEAASRTAAGWNHIDGVWYYLDADGTPVTGWVQDGGNWYYTDSRGAMTSGFKIVDGRRYYLNASGVLQTGWFLIDGYYHYADENGSICSGWTVVDGIRYYLRSDGLMMSGWQNIDGKKYFLNASGVTQTGWVLVNGVYYYADADGVMQTGWILDDGKYYYLDSNSAMTSGWKYIDGYWYYLNASGVMQVGWVDEGGNRYFLNASGHMMTGWIDVDGTRYYMNSSGAMVRNAWVGDYYCGGDGTLATNEKMDGVSKRSSNRIVYSSKTLHIVIEKHRDSGSTYWTAHVQTSSPNQLRSAMSYDSYGGKRQKTSEAVASHGGVIGINGSAFDYGSGKPSPLGMCIKDGVIYGDYMTSYTVMATTYSGLIFTPPQGLMGADLLNMGVKDTYNFGPILINNGIPQMPIEVTSYKDPRVAVGMIAPNDYVLLCADGRGAGGSRGLNHNQMVSIFQSFGCSYAYNLDGGGSATLYYNGVVLNNPSDGYERPCADFLFFTQ